MPPQSLPRVAELTETASGIGFFLCARKEVRQTKTGDPFLSLTLQDATGTVGAKVFGAEAEQYRDQFEAGEFVAVEGRANLFQGRTELILSRVRRVNPPLSLLVEGVTGARAAQQGGKHVPPQMGRHIEAHRLAARIGQAMSH